ncbi:hypothetical protein BDY19DRAFT_885436 [Irpex rosettiformis]|uniref:Uncharacterized protein n=1 Tax=Irpex rosettiformis TaxID=378272 RepID=A0ACB8UBF3_9APHY|nr:hypothetical protein BDY19DRAFT_885436 [Irpex rosettiformis]
MPQKASNLEPTLKETSSAEYLVTAILPVNDPSLDSLQLRIMTLLDPSLHVHEVLLLCHPEHHSEVREILFEVLSEDTDDHHTDASIFSWPAQMEEGAAVLYAAQHVEPPQDRILVLGSDGLDTWNSETRKMLVGRFATPLPVGPRGFTIQGDEPFCIVADATPNAASFLVPPFSIAPLLVPPHELYSDPIFDIWPSLGHHISRARFEGVGGVVVDYDKQSTWCPVNDKRDPSTTEIVSSKTAHEGESETFAILLPSLDDLVSFAAPVCHLWAEGHNIGILLTEEDPSLANITGSSVQLLPSCALKANILSDLRLTSPLATPAAWIANLQVTPTIVISVPTVDISAHASSESLTHIQIPREDLPFCDWLSTIPLQAWKSWYKPQLEVSVITNDRPESLMRLLTSLSNASFFGDEIHLRINVEQTADEETLRLVDAYQWPHGAKFVHRRVVQGGLLPAVVESWYPSSNDSYGLMLEDDVELSPLFYAWAKMSLLMYRYGRPEDRSPQLFGISLYQQRNLELRPEGRHPFNAQKLFSALHHPHPHIPYLSQIPCSWGAVYFPEHWREFHDYLAIRLSQTQPDLPIDRIVAPGLRSNKWTRSWKKYFIELVYLRGYVMLYPNFKDYLSFSTNHLEVGSHVREMSAKAYERKKKLYLLPLMERPPQLSGLDDTDRPDPTLAIPPTTDLMGLPEKRMPSWDGLPVLDLLGLIVTEGVIQQRGATRREELFQCDSPDRPFDIPALLCLPDHEDMRLDLEED